MELGAGRAAGRGRASAAAGRRAERDATLEEGATAAPEPSHVALHQHDDLFGVLRPPPLQADIGVQNGRRNLPRGYSALRASLPQLLMLD